MLLISGIVTKTGHVRKFVLQIFLCTSTPPSATKKDANWKSSKRIICSGHKLECQSIDTPVDNDSTDLMSKPKKYDHDKTLISTVPLQLSTPPNYPAILALPTNYEKCLCMLVLALSPRLWIFPGFYRWKAGGPALLCSALYAQAFIPICRIRGDMSWELCSTSGVDKSLVAPNWWIGEGLLVTEFPKEGIFYMQGLFEPSCLTLL